MAKTSLPPGFRFHPTDVELVWYYLKRKIMGKPFRFEAIAEIELYKFAPWDLPVKSCLQSRDLEWYFFCPRDRKYANGTRANRATESGYWKTSGKDRTIVYDSQTVGMKKTLIFHSGKPPHGTRTDWVMYEFRLESMELVNAGFSQDAFVVCKIFQKSGAGPKNGEQYGAPFVDEDWDDIITENDNTVALPCQEPSYDHPSLSNPAPSQSAHFEVGEPSLALYLSEAGAMSSVPAQSITSEFCETLSMLPPPKIGQQSSMPALSYADVILLEQLEEFLNTSPPHGENSSGQMLVSPILHEDVNGMLNEDAQAVYGQSDEGSHLLGIGLEEALQQGMGLDDTLLPDIMGCEEALQQGMGLDDILLPDIMGCEEALQQGMGLDDILSPGIMGCEEALQQGMGLDDILSPGITGCDGLHHLLSEFTGEKYVEINDLNFLSANGPFELANPNDTRYPFANNSSAQDLSSTCMDSGDATSAPSVL